MTYLLHHIIVNSAKKYTNSPAFRFLNQTLTYSDLDTKTNQLANSLIEHDVKPGDRVGIYLNKSLECAIAIYGILKSGAAYVPLDPGAPLLRLKNIVDDCGIRCIVTHEPKRIELTRFLTEYNTPIEYIVGLSEAAIKGVKQISWENIYLQPDETVSDKISDGDLAYIMYTSGSTGIPKGIMHTHYSGLSYARMSSELYDISCNDKLSNHSPLHFDMSTFDYFSGPLVGASTVIIPEAYTKLPASLTELIEAEKLTIWYSVPFALIQMLSLGLLDKRNLTSLRLIMFGGEPFQSKYLTSLMEQWPQALFSNVYGPTELNQCTWFTVPKSWKKDDPNTPIGNLCANNEALIVDEDDNVVTTGEIGELLIKSPTMMKGYWNRPELNNKVFYTVVDKNDVTSHFYRTGDLVLEDKNKELNFLGRKDRQIKIRGFRIELDEIESTLTSHPSVEEAAAYIVVTGETQRIEAAVTLNKHDNVTLDKLHEYISQFLPAYAVPGKMSILKSFPRTSSGKIDRNRLR